MFDSLKKGKFDIFLIVLLIIGIAAFAVQAHFVSKINFIGSSDPAFYAEVADNLIKGKGFVMDFINSYFVKFDSITHPEEYGFPGVSIILVPFILLFGKTAFAVKLPSMIAGVILFPILTYYLGKDFFNKRIGFLAAVSLIFYPSIFPISFGGERDILYAFFLVAGFYFFYKGVKSEETKTEILNAAPLIKFLKENKYFLLMGAFLGYSYLIRQTTLAFIPVLIIVYYLLNKKFSKNFLAGLGVCALVMAPWLIRNYLVFGDPFFTVNKYIGWVVGYAGFSQEGIFRIYWSATKPGIALLLQQPGGLSGFISDFIFRSLMSLVSQFHSFLALAILAFLGTVLSSARILTKKFIGWVVFLVIISAVLPFLSAFITIKTLFLINNFFLLPFIYLFLASLPYILMLLTLLFLFRKGSSGNTLFTILWAVFALFFAALWVFDTRYWLPLLPFLFIYSWFALEKLLSYKKVVQFFRNPRDVEKILVALLLILVLATLPKTFGNFFDKDSPFPYKDDADAKTILHYSEKIKSTVEEDAVIMGCDIGVLHFYTDRKYVTFPSERLAETVSLMKTYNVSYFSLMRCDRRGIDKALYSNLVEYDIFKKEDAAAGTYEAVITDFSANWTVYKIVLPVALKSKIFGAKITNVANRTNLEITQQ